MTPPTVRDVVVVGAGPAGSMAAAGLARRGADVVVLEEHAEVGSPVHCTGLLGADAFEEFQLPRELLLGTTGTARFCGTSGPYVAVESPRIRATVIDRAGLDRTLAGRAIAAGAEFRLGTRVESIVTMGDRVRVQCRGEATPLDARACVLACGANYRFHKALGLGVPDVFLQTAQVETSVAPNAAGGAVEVRFGREVAPAGFAWLVPLSRDGEARARVGVMTETKSRDRFQGWIDHLAARGSVNAASVPAPRLKVLPLSPVPRTYASRVLAVGDAAGLVKPTTGGGIYYGMLSGDMAADTLADALDRDRLDARDLRSYEARWRDRLGREIRAGLSFRRIAARLNDASIDALVELARVNGVVPLLQETASFNWHRKAAMALLAHPSVRRIILSSWRTHANLI